MLEVWKDLKEKILFKFQSQLQQIYATLISDNLVLIDKTISLEEVLKEIKSFREQKKLAFKSAELNNQSAIHQEQLNKIFEFVSSDDCVDVRDYTFEEVLAEAKSTWKELEQLRNENWKLKRKLDGYGSDDGGDWGGEVG